MFAKWINYANLFSLFMYDTDISLVYEQLSDE